MGRLEEYIPIVGQGVIDDLKALAERLEGKTIQHINSTAVGGGVAEILTRMVPLFQELNVNTMWDVIKGGEKFFEVTKKFHNALHGKAEEISEDDFAVFMETSINNLNEMQCSGDVVYVHDPQPIALVQKKSDNKWIWRC